MPRHVAIIMDGNGRWATQRGLPRSAGHRQGVEALRRTVRAAADMGISILTLYSFSTENWARPQAEVRFLLELLRRFIRTDVADLHKSNVRIMIIGDRDGLEPSLCTMFEEAEALTRHNTALKLVIAFNYGSRQEITRAVQAIARQVADGTLAAADITPAVISSHLDTAGLPDPDLLIRTGGEQRISNYLLWQCAYTEFVFLPEYWPEFDAHSLARAIDTFRMRDRRFGGLKAQTA
jgi:undecaprenyl diphosphate synthase